MSFNFGPPPLPAGYVVGAKMYKVVRVGRIFKIFTAQIVEVDKGKSDVYLSIVLEDDKEHTLGKFKLGQRTVGELWYFDKKQACMARKAQLDHDYSGVIHEWKQCLNSVLNEGKS